MSHRYYTNNAPQTTLAAGITSLDTDISLASLSGFPASFPYTATLELGDAVNAEVVLVTSVAGSVATVTRGYNNTTAVAHSAGKTFDHTVGEIEFREANDHVNATSSVHGVTGDVVGTTDVQTVSNKTISGGTFTGSVTASGLTLAGPTISSPTVTGTLDAADGGFSGTLDVAGDLTASAAVNAAGSGTGLAVANNATVGGTLGVTGASTQAAVTASGLVTASAGLTVTGKYLKLPSFTNEAAADSAIGSVSDGMKVYLTAPTGTGYSAGEYVSIGGTWVPTSMDGWHSYTPTWRALSGTQPTLGSSSLLGRYCMVGVKACAVSIAFQNSGASGGNGTTGGYSFDLPFQSRSSMEQELLAKVATPAVQLTGWAYVPTSNNIARPYLLQTNGSAGLTQMTYGFPGLSTGASIVISGVYEIA